VVGALLLAVGVLARLFQDQWGTAIDLITPVLAAAGSHLSAAGWRDPTSCRPRSTERRMSGRTETGWIPVNTPMGRTRKAPGWEPNVGRRGSRDARKHRSGDPGQRGPMPEIMVKDEKRHRIAARRPARRPCRAQPGSGVGLPAGAATLVLMYLGRGLWLPRPLGRRPAGRLGLAGGPMAFVTHQWYRLTWARLRLLPIFGLLLLAAVSPSASVGPLYLPQNWRRTQRIDPLKELSGSYRSAISCIWLRILKIAWCFAVAAWYCSITGVLF